MDSFPAERYKDEFVESVWGNPVTILTGPTGSGKSTVLLPHLIDAGFADSGMIGVTEPRRPIAQWLARYVSKKRGQPLGAEVGYQIRFEDETNAGTRFKFMTDGILLREFQLDRDLRKYSVIVVDEAHEGSLNIHLVLGLLKDLLRRRRDLRVVVASATIDEGVFSSYFSNAPIVAVEGRMFPVDTVYSNEDIFPLRMPAAVVAKIDKIHKFEPRGDVLVFMPGKAEIDEVIRGVEELGFDDLTVFPMYRDLSEEEKERVLDDCPGKRKVIVSTNIAESGVTFDSMRYEVDSGLEKLKNFHPEMGMDSLDTVESAQDHLGQRLGRIGRTCEGTCYRMYTEDNFCRRPKYTKPEIQRTSLSSVVLLMEDIGIEDIPNFNFICPPERAAFTEAYETLIALGAIERGKKGLTELGKAMAALPISDPRQSRMVLKAEEYGCVRDVATIAAFLSAKNVFVRPKEKAYEADRAHAKFKDPTSDALTFLRVWRAYVDNGATSDWCFENFLNGRALSEIGQIRQQLFALLEEEGIELSESGSPESVSKAVVSGLVYNLLRSGMRHAYSGVLRGIGGIYIHPGSVAFGRDPRWVVATEIVETTRIFARGCTVVEPAWLPEIAPKLFLYGRIKLKSYNPGDDFVMAERPITYNGEHIGDALVKLDLETARKHQESMIAGSRQEGLIRLTFREKKHPLYSFMSTREAVCNGTTYTTYSSDVRDGSTFYCRTSVFMGKGTADPVFQVFNFPSAQPAAVEERPDGPKFVQPVGKPGSLSTSSQVDLNLLAAAWGARFKK